jgi:hypothetical protein
METDAPVTISGTTIRPSDEAKYLGVNLDNTIYRGTSRVITSVAEFVRLLIITFRRNVGKVFKQYFPEHMKIIGHNLQHN